MIHLRVKGMVEFQQPSNRKNNFIYGTTSDLKTKKREHDVDDSMSS